MTRSLKGRKTENNKFYVLNGSLKNVCCGDFIMPCKRYLCRCFVLLTLPFPKVISASLFSSLNLSVLKYVTPDRELKLTFYLHNLNLLKSHLRRPKGS